jgi:hypothetical protein
VPVRPRSPRKALVVAGSILAGVLSGCASSASHAGSGSRQFVGFTWRIVAVERDHSRVGIPRALGGFVAFARDRSLHASDSVNHYFGRYRADGNSYRALNVGTTLVGYGGHDHARLSLIDAVQALTQSDLGVNATLRGDQLVLTTARYTITCSQSGIAPNERTPSPTSTAS